MSGLAQQVEAMLRDADEEFPSMGDSALQRLEYLVDALQSSVIKERVRRKVEAALSATDPLNAPPRIGDSLDANLEPITEVIPAVRDSNNS